MKNKLLSILFLVLTMSLAAQVPSYVPTNGLVGWWPFNGNANDESGGINFGVVNGATLTQDRFGTPNSAYDFSQGNTIEIPENQTLYNISLATVNLWIKTTTQFEATLFKKGNSGTVSNGEQISIQLNQFIPGNLGVHGFSAKYNSNCNPGSGWLDCNSNLASLNDGVWHMVTAVINTDRLRFYVDGNLIISTVTPNWGMDICNNSGITLGKNWNSDSDWYSGVIDDVGFWNRPLSQQEISDLFNSCQLSVSVQPNSQTTITGGGATFIVNTTTPNVSFQWQTDTGSGFQNISNSGQYNGADNNTLTVSNITLSNNNQLFRCIISSGNCADTSQTAILNVCGAITSQPLAQSTTPNQNVQFSTTSTDPSATFQWQSNVGFGFQNLNNVGQYSGVNTNTLTVSNVSLSNNNQPFRCIITSGICTTATQVAVLTVNNNMDTENWSNAGLVVYPNPAQDHMVIKVNPSWIGSSYAFMDAAGRTLFHGQLNALEETISLKTFSAGIYLIKVGDKFQQYLRVIKE